MLRINLSLFTKSFLLFFLSIQSIAIFSEEIETADMDQICFDSIPKDLSDAFINLNMILEHVALAIHNGIVTCDQNKIIKMIRNYRNFAHQVNETKLSGITKKQAAELLSAALHIEKGIRGAFKTSFKEFSQIDQTEAIKETQRLLQASPENLLAEAANLLNRTIDLQKKTETIGLSTINRTYRCILNNAPIIIGGTLVILAGGGIYMLIKHKNTLFDCLPEIKSITLKSIHEKAQGVSVIAGTPVIIANFLGIEIMPSKSRVNLGDKANSALDYAFNKGINPLLYTIHRSLKGGSIKKNHDNDGLVITRTTTASLDDIIGNETIKKEMKLVIEYMADYINFDRAGLKIDNILLVGPTRTGKTYAVEILQGAINAKFAQQGKQQNVALLKITPSLVKKYGIEQIINFALQYAPAIIFIDEIELCGLQREQDQAMVSDMLIALSTTNRSEEKKVIIIGATNDVSKIDPALRQPGRFAKEIYFTYPSKNDRYEFLRRQLLERGIPLNQHFNTTINELAVYTSNASYDGLKALVNQAFIQARTDRRPIEPTDLKEALNSTIRKITPEFFNRLSSTEKEEIAWYIAGVALGNKLFHGMDTPIEATILPRAPKQKETHLFEKYKTNNEKSVIRQEGDFRYGSVFTAKEKTNNQEKKAQAILCGQIAKSLIYGPQEKKIQPSKTAKVIKMAQKIMFGSSNPDLTQMSKKYREKKLQEIERLIEKWETEARDLLAQHKQTLEKLADELSVKKTITNDDIEAIMRKWPASTAAAA